MSNTSEAYGFRQLGSSEIRAHNITLTETEKKFFSDDNNFIEYFIEIGVKPELFNQKQIFKSTSINDINSKLIPDIISKFPYFEKKSMGIDDTIIDFVFPHGFKAISSSTKPQPIFYSLILDNQFYSGVYTLKFIGCLLIYESMSQYKILCDLLNGVSNTNNKQQENYKNIYIPKVIALASVHPCINIFEQILRQIYSNIELKKNLFIDQIIEKLVCQTPKLPLGYRKIYLRFENNKVIDLTQKKMNELITVTVNLKELFKLFSTEKICDIFRYMLYEIKMIFFSSNISNVSNIIMCFLILLKPFKYQYQIISILPKEYYSFLEADSPGIFGVNETFSQKFFDENRISIEERPVCCVDIDHKDFSVNFCTTGNKDQPQIPKHLKEKIDKRVEEYKKEIKNKKKEETNEMYQYIFYKFMVNLLKDYPKFLKKNNKKDKVGVSLNIKDMIDKDAYINSESNSDQDFYRTIFNTQMFENLIMTRMYPKDTKDKIAALFFEEKLNEKIATKKLFGGSKIKEQNTLLISDKYDYDKNVTEIIDLSENNKTSALSQKTLQLFLKGNIKKEECYSRGFDIKESGNAIYFTYYLFPILLSEKLFKSNSEKYIVPSKLTKQIDMINESIIEKCILKFDDYKKSNFSEMKNDVLICYLIIWALTYSYTDKDEKAYRFSNLIETLDKIEMHDIEVIELLFQTLANLNDEQNILSLYSKYMNLHLNPTWKIFTLVSKYVHKQNIYPSQSGVRSGSKPSINYGIPSKSLSTSFSKGESMQVKKHDNKTYRIRSIRLPNIDEDILGEEILFNAYGSCVDCKKGKESNEVVNLGNICNTLSSKDIKDNRFKCNKCGNFSLQKLNFQLGTELFNKKISNDSSSVNIGINLFSPTYLKKDLLQIANAYKNNNFDVENFRVNFPEEFWNSIWYFQLQNIDISFMLPYMKQSKIKFLQGSNTMNKSLNYLTQNNNNESTSERINILHYKSPNNKIQIVKTGKVCFGDESLIIQHVYKIAIFKTIGMFLYKSDNYIENVGFNEQLLMVTESNNSYNNINSINNLSLFLNNSNVNNDGDSSKMMDNSTTFTEGNDGIITDNGNNNHDLDDVADLFSVINPGDNNYQNVDEYMEDNYE